MASVYNDGDFTTASQHGQLRYDYPFSDFGDDDAIIIYRDMRVIRANYAQETVGTPLAGFTGSRFCKDINFLDVSANVIQFTQVYATVPAPHTDYGTGIYTTPPEFDTTSTIERYKLDGTDIVPAVRRITEFISKDAQSRNVPARLEYSYTTSPATATILTREGYTIEKSEPSVSGSEATVITYNDAVSTVVTTGTTDVLEDTRLSKWLGDIYEVLTVYKL